MTHGSLFSGIGGFDLAAQWMGWENVFHCEWNPFGQKILNHYWPNAISYHDITKTDFSIHRGAIDILTGGFPCQPYSQAGKRLGKEDERHLWPEMLRAIREIQPRWVVGENVLGLVNWSGGLVFHEVQADLEAEGYEVQPFVLPACAVNAPHRRDRVWFVAYANGDRHRPAVGRFNDETIGLSEEDGQEWGRTRKFNGTSDVEPGRQPEGVYDSNRISGDAAHADRNRLVGSDREHEEQSGERGFNAQRDIEQGAGDGDAADSDGIGISKSREEYKAKQFIKNGDKRRIIADTNEKRFSSERQPTELGRFGFGVNNAQSNESDWKNFPTVSPICHADDGLSDRLDNITFSRWRQESIKGGGNAVVPQVVLRIFQTIEEYEINAHG